MLRSFLVCALLILASCGGGPDRTGRTDSAVPPGTDGGPAADGSTGGGCVPSFEICGDGVDQNCDGREDSCGNTDGDAFEACRAGQAPPACDCNDREAAVYPGAPELCNGIDDDCDGRVDEIASCCPACAGMVERADSCTPAGACVCSTEGAGDAPCAAGQTCCASGCTDLASDFNNCGLCQAACTAQADRCTAGTCQCGSNPPCDYINMCVSGACG